ncbi:MAG: hypothetical protein HQ564_10445 [Candidatus Saganbacteria bacterium]|nr:hypothetical protein [Candidatus Saganbacteria bacterium]
MPKCIGPAPASGCRLLGLRDHVVKHATLLTTRPSKLTIHQLASPSSVIKGLYYPPGCPQGQGTVAFSRRESDGLINDKSHTDIASDLGLRVQAGPCSIGDGSGVRTGQRELSDPDIKGFILHPITFEGEEKPLLSIPTKEDFGSIKVEAPDTRSLTFMQMETMVGGGIIAIMYINAPHMSGMWAVTPRSGLTGEIPYLMRSDFVDTLSRHVSPDFTIIRFLEMEINTFRRMFSPGFGVDNINEYAQEKVSERKTTFQEPLAVSHEEVLNPSCLRWPKEMQLIPED